MHWLITYQWKRRADKDWIIANSVHKGRVGEWMLIAWDQPEDWIFLNAQGISGEDYESLKDIF